MSGLVFRWSIPCAVRGRFSAMMDMGGMSPGGGAAVKAINGAGKNIKVRAVAFNFNLLIQSMAKDKKENNNPSLLQTTISSTPSGILVRSDEPKLQTTSTIIPDVGTVQTMANLLNIDLGGNMLGGKKQLTKSSSSMDGESIGELSAVFDAALLAEQTTPNSATQSPLQQKELKRFTTKAPPTSDIRNKYAKELRDKMESGCVSGIDLAKQETGDYT
eukprot:scaffold106755_cov65-Attheya_sp.AAC.2